MKNMKNKRNKRNKEVIKEIKSFVDWLEEQEAFYFKYGINRDYLNAVYMNGLYLLSDLNSKEVKTITVLEAIHYLKMRTLVVESLTLDLKLYQLSQDIKSLFK